MILWKNSKHLIAGTTLRDITKAEVNNMALHCGGNLDAVIENRQALSETLDISLAQWTFAQQTHSDHVHYVTKDDIGKGASTQADAISDCDALYTRSKDIAIGVFHADCAAILLHDPIENIICAIHAGWMGTIQQITTKTIQQLLALEGCKAENLEAYIAPCIAFPSFEVGLEVVAQVKLLPFDTEPFIAYKDNGKALIDNKGLNHQMLLAAGILEKHITIDKNDTFQENESFFSYRRDKTCGRHLSFILQK